jgi:hypothetical protein
MVVDAVRAGPLLEGNDDDGVEELRLADAPENILVPAEPSRAARTSASR